MQTKYKIPLANDPSMPPSTEHYNVIVKFSLELIEYLDNFFNDKCKKVYNIAIQRLVNFVKEEFSKIENGEASSDRRNIDTSPKVIPILVTRKLLNLNPK